MTLATENEIVQTSTVGSSQRGSCRASGLCCQSKNNTCRGTLNDEEDSNDAKKQITTRCFCDAACLDIGDCCEDYVQSCQRKYIHTRGIGQNSTRHV